MVSAHTARAAIRGAVIMGGPISVNDADTRPPLADYRERLRTGLADLRPAHARAVFDAFARRCAQPRGVSAELTSESSGR